MEIGYGIGRRVSAWAVHAFTGSGAVLGFLALFAAIDGYAAACLGWLGLALVVDGIDGTLARKASVGDVLPQVDGATLDLVIDYLNYVVVPAVFLYRFGLFPEGFGLVGAAWVLLTSLYCFSRTDMKSGDAFFVGFPAIWNVVALHLWLLGWDPWANAAIALVLGVLTFTDVKFLHPFRVRRLMTLNIAAAALWLLGSTALVLTHPERSGWALAAWVAGSLWYAAVSAWRTMRHATP
ncbi:CDP-alcohol phosphatidyltransferase family protein [Arenibaculum pallidiluteum]|uniref:CDP-alcohol phosphatidyltransferase family protein n=1 Tax=Arenibaculum pallidiluteum TaxID=2812559 RepID=UPI001A961247|nr:phosphatidylcholine/phosphatidylserine synthase [Arenibaculum pallidiluteum]